MDIDLRPAGIAEFAKLHSLMIISQHGINLQYYNSQFVHLSECLSLCAGL